VFHRQTCRFTVDAELLRELGERLVGRQYIALAELVKNSFDADASKVEIRLQLDADDQISLVLCMLVALYGEREVVKRLAGPGMRGLHFGACCRWGRVFPRESPCVRPSPPGTLPQLPNIL